MPVVVFVVLRVVRLILIIFFYVCVHCICRGAMCIIAAGTSAQPLVATLFQMAFLLCVLKLAPYDGDVDDQASFIAALTLTLTMLCGFALMMDNSEDPNFDPGITGAVLIIISVTCLVLEIGIMMKDKFLQWRENKMGEIMNSKKTKVAPAATISSGSVSESDKNKVQNWDVGE